MSLTPSSIFSASKNVPVYGELVTDYDGVLNLEKARVDSDSLVIKTIADRFWLNYGADAGEIRIGRQRINQGSNPVWNPNDLLYAFDYLDFDYEERPGTHAVRAEIYLGDMSSIDDAFKWANIAVDNVGAVRIPTFIPDAKNLMPNKHTSLIWHLPSVLPCFDQPLRDICFRSELAAISADHFLFFATELGY